MSGGVDSAVSAALLKKAGFEVIGVFMKFWVDDPGVADGVCLPQNRCCSDESEQLARKTAFQLNIPFYVLDMRNEFKKAVVDRFIVDTKKGLTPNPCAACNHEIKFGLLIQMALKMGADYVATGHYCQIKKDRNGVYHLFKGKDKDKDQSYFLWRLGQKQLSRMIFPVGSFLKKEVRSLAKKWKLPSAKTPESQEVCFAGGNMTAFLEKYCGRKLGNIVNEDGKVLGKHNGLWFYTIGQRKGINLSGGPFYVLSKKRMGNKLIVTKFAKEIGASKIGLTGVHWINQNAPKLPIEIKSKIRYRGKEIAAVLDKISGEYELKSKKPQIAAASGQPAVFCKGDEVVGGGSIR